MAEDFRFQLSLKLPGRDPRGNADDMLNIRANTSSEFLDALNSFLDEPQPDVVEAIAAVTVSVKAASVAAQGLSTVTVPAPAGQGNDEAQAQGTAPAAQADPVPGPFQPAFVGVDRNCQHGTRNFRSGKSGKGPWAGLYCPLPQERKSEQCSVEWAADKKKLPAA